MKYQEPRDTAATRVYNLYVYRYYTNRNTTQGTMVCPIALSSLSLLAHDFMLEVNILCMICTSTYTAMALWTIDSVLCTHSMILHQPRNIKRQGTVAATRLDITLRLLWVQGLTLRLDLVQLQASLFCWLHPNSCSYLLHEVVSIAPPSLVPGVVLTSNANN